MIINGVASEYEMPQKNNSEKITDLQKQIIFECAVELLYHTENRSNEEIAHRILDAINDKLVIDKYCKMDSNSEVLNPYEKYLHKFAENHRMTIEEAKEQPMVKARLHYFQETGQ